MLRCAGNSTIAGIILLNVTVFLPFCMGADYADFLPIPEMRESEQFHSGKWWKKENGNWQYWQSGKWNTYKAKVKANLIRDHPKSVVIYRQPVIVQRKYVVQRRYIVREQKKPAQITRQPLLKRIFNR